MKLRDILIWILFIITMIIIFWYFFGSSSTFEHAILILIIIILFTISAKISDVGVRIGLLEKRFERLEGSFIKLVDDFKKGKRGGR